jgi:hypothetical protein
MVSNEMQGVTLVNKPQDKQQPNQKVRGTSPNVIGNIEDLPPFSFGLKNLKHQPPVVVEERKAVAIDSNQKISLSQFMRNVHSKRDLVYALGIKGKPSSLH